jgi:hypothetical protein
MLYDEHGYVWNRWLKCVGTRHGNVTIFVTNPIRFHLEEPPFNCPRNFEIYKMSRSGLKRE